MDNALESIETMFEQVSQVPLSANDIAETLEADIIFGHLHPRERLVESTLQHRFGATRHVIRQAIAQLVTLGIVVYQKNIGAMVKSYTKQEVMDLYELREILETNAAQRISFPIQKKSLQMLKKIQKEHDLAIANKDPRAVFLTNIRFHKVLFSLTDNPLLSATIEECARKAHIVRFRSMVNPSSLELARKEHWKIIEALEAQDRSGLVHICKRHLTPSRDAYLEQYSIR